MPLALIQHEDPPGEALARTVSAGKSGRFVVHKLSCDAFFDTDLMELVHQSAITQLMIGDCVTQSCIDTITLGLSRSALT